MNESEKTKNRKVSLELQTPTIMIILLFVILPIVKTFYDKGNEIEEYKTEIINYKNQITEYESKVSEYESRILEYENKISDLENEISELEDKISYSDSEDYDDSEYEATIDLGEYYDTSDYSGDSYDYYDFSSFWEE